MAAADRPRGHGEKLSRLQARAIAALLAAPTVEAAARQAGVGERTLRRWMRREDFREALHAAQEEALAMAVARLGAASGEAVDALCRNLRCGTPAVEVQAARALLEAVLRLGEHLDLASRVEELERRLAGGGQHG